MDTIKFKTTIKCALCVAKVKPFLNEALGENTWEVDIKSPSKILTVAGETNEAKINEALKKIGYKVEAL